MSEGRIICEVCGKEINEREKFPKFGEDENLKVFCSKKHFLNWLAKEWNLEIVTTHVLPIRGTIREQS